MRGKPSTNEFYRAVLDNALREQWVIQKPDVHRAKQERSRRLSSLYGYNMASSVIRERVGGKARGKKASASGAERRKDGRRAISPYADEARLRESKSSGELDGMYRPSLGLLGSGEELAALANDGQGASVPGVPREATPPNAKQRQRQAQRLRRQRPRGKSPRRGRNAARAKVGALASGSTQETLPADEEEDGSIAEPEQPWYLGYQNSSSIPLSSAAAQRYGHSGTLNILRSERGLSSKSVDYGFTCLTLPHSLPKYRGDETIVDEYTPQISGPPRGWPQKADYVTGSSLKPREPVPEVPEHMQQYLRRVHEEVDAMKSNIVRERKMDALARNSMASGVYKVQVDLHTGRPKNEKNKLLQEGKRMRYWSGMTAVCAIDDDKEAVTRALEKERLHTLRMSELKWSESFYLYKLLRSVSMQLRPNLEEFFALLTDLRAAVSRNAEPAGEAAEDRESCADADAKTARSHSTLPKLAEAGDEAGDEDIGAPSQSAPSGDGANESSVSREYAQSGVMINREAFMNVLCGIFEHADRRRINKLYSSFDPARCDAVDYRAVMVAQRCFWKHHEDGAEKLLAMWGIMDQHRSSGVLSFEEVTSIFTACSVYDEERCRIEDLLKETGPYFFSHTAFSPPGFLHEDEFRRMLAVHGASANHPLIAEFTAQMQLRLEAFQAQAREAAAPAAEAPQADA